ncbi:MAG: hypothetical protein ACP5JG_00830, partial [Anaerolineae bacterium]
MLNHIQTVEIRKHDKHLDVGTAPDVPGLTFRGFRGEEDFAKMLVVIDGSREVDQRDDSETLEDLKRSYRHLTNSDPYEDMIFAEVDGDVVGYGRVWWVQVEDGSRVYN